MAHSRGDLCRSPFAADQCAPHNSSDTAVGYGTTSSSDGQYFRAGGRGEKLADINARHGNEQGVTFYTHLSDQFGPYYTKVIAAIASEAPHVLD
jgi:TnpA family transposase